MEENKKLYSQRAIAITTYLGGPLAAGILIRENYKALEKEKQGKYAFIIGIVSTIIIFVGVFLIPENIISKIPNVLIPLIYTGIISLIVEKIQGTDLKSYKENNQKFQSLWKAAGIGAICLAIILAVIALTAFIAGDFANTSPKFDAVTYDKELAKFTENETVSLKVFNSIETKSSETIIVELNDGLNLWRQNKSIIESVSKLKDLPEILTIQNEKLNKYCDLRIEHFEILLKAQAETTDKYSTQINEIGMKIEKVIEEIKQ